MPLLDLGVTDHRLRYGSELSSWTDSSCPGINPGKGREKPVNAPQSPILSHCVKGNTRSKLVHSQEDKSFCLGEKKLSFQWRAQYKDVLSGAAAAISNTIRGTLGEDRVKRITKKQNPAKNYSVVCVHENSLYFVSQTGSAFLLFASQSLLIQFGYIAYHN